jgi:hypothetical protein
MRAIVANALRCGSAGVAGFDAAGFLRGAMREGLQIAPRRTHY